jgi:hypothetical protein
MKGSFSPGATGSGRLDRLGRGVARVSSSPQARPAAVGEDAKPREKNQAEDVVERHHHAGEPVGEAEGLGEHLGDQAVEDLPE